LLAEPREEVVVQWNFAALKPLPCAVVRAARNREVDVARGDIVREFVVQDCLQGGDYL